MKIKLVGTIMCVMAIAIISSGCLTTTQKGTAIGTGAGAALGTGFGALAGSASTGALDRRRCRCSEWCTCRRLYGQKERRGGIRTVAETTSHGKTIQIRAGEELY